MNTIAPEQIAETTILIVVKAPHGAVRRQKEADQMAEQLELFRQTHNLPPFLLLLPGWEVEAITTSDTKCRSCGTKQQISFAPCPYAQDIHGDDRPVWMCDDCRHQAAQDI